MMPQRAASNGSPGCQSWPAPFLSGVTCAAAKASPSLAAPGTDFKAQVQIMLLTPSPGPDPAHCRCCCCGCSGAGCWRQPPYSGWFVQVGSPFSPLAMSLPNLKPMLKAHKRQATHTQRVGRASPTAANRRLHYLDSGSHWETDHAHSRPPPRPCQPAWRPPGTILAVATSVPWLAHALCYSQGRAAAAFWSVRQSALCLGWAQLQTALSSHKASVEFQV